MLGAAVDSYSWMAMFLPPFCLLEISTECLTENMSSLSQKAKFSSATEAIKQSEHDNQLNII